MATRLQPVSNESIFNAVRMTMSQAFQDRIPEANKDNMKDIGTMITSDDFEVEFNAWQKALVNRIGLTLFYQKMLQNPLSDLIYGTMSWGDAIEEIATDLVTGRTMDYGKEGQSIDPFVKISPQAHAIYHKINEPIQYMTSIEKHRIRRAFLAEGGLTRLIGMFVSQLYSSANLDTWLLTKSIMAYYINDSKAADGYPLLAGQKVTSTDVVDEASSKKFLLQIMNALSAASMPNNNFNPQQLWKTLDRREFTLFVRYDILNTIGVEAMASAFHRDNLNLNVTIKEMDDFGTDPNGKGTDDVMAVLAEDWWLLITQQYEEMESIYNPRGQYWNYFLTRQMSFGASYFKDCVIFRKNWA